MAGASTIRPADPAYPRGMDAITLAAVVDKVEQLLEERPGSRLASRLEALTREERRRWLAEQAMAVERERPVQD